MEGVGWGDPHRRLALVFEMTHQVSVRTRTLRRSQARGCRAKSRQSDREMEEAGQFVGDQDHLPGRSRPACDRLVESAAEPDAGRPQAVDYPVEAAKGRHQPVHACLRVARAFGGDPNSQFGVVAGRSCFGRRRQRVRLPRARSGRHRLFWQDKMDGSIQHPVEGRRDEAMLRWKSRLRVELSTRPHLPRFVSADGELDQTRWGFGERLYYRSERLRLRVVERMQRIDIKPKAGACCAAFKVDLRG